MSSRKHAFRTLACHADHVRWARRSMQYSVDPFRKDLAREYAKELVRFGEEVMRVRMMEAAIFVSGGRWVK